MKILHTIFFCAFLILIPINSNSQFATSDIDDNASYTHIIDQDLLNTPLRLRAVFDYYTKLDLTKKKNRREVDKIILIEGYGDKKTIEEYIKLFSTKFIVYNVRKHKQKDKKCGENTYDIVIVINPEALESLIIKLTEDDKICSIMDNQIRYKRYRYKGFFKRKYKDYWI